MVSFLKGRRRTDGDSIVTVDPTAAQAAMLEGLITRAEAAAEQLRALEPVLDRSEELDVLRERCTAVEQAVARVERLAAQLEAMEQRAERFAGVAEEMERMQGRMGSLSDKVDTAVALRDEVEKFLQLEGPVNALRTDAEGLRGQLAELADNVARMRTQHDDALTAHRHTTSRLETFDQDFQAATGRLEDAVRRVQAVERALEPLNQASTAIPDVQHQLAVLKSLADQVAQKATLLEQQREAVDRAANQISQLTRLDRELDAWLRRQEEQIRRFGPIEAKLGEIKAIQDKVMARTDELQVTSLKIDESQQSARQSLTDLREQMRKSSEGFELENRGLHAVSERIADLRNAVKECEARFAVLDAASQGTAAVQGQVRAVADQAVALSGDLSRLADEARRVGGLRQDAERLDKVAAETADRMRRIGELKPQVDEVVQHLSNLTGTREAMADGFEQMRLAYEEMNRVRESQAETQAWLANTDVWTRNLQGQVKELSRLEPAVERIRGEVEQVKEDMAEIDSRRGLVDEVHRRLSELGGMSAELKDRTEGLRGRMDAAESRFAQLARQADEANAVSDTIAGVTASVGEVERRTTAIDGSVRALESRTQQLDEVEERIRLLGSELEQRQGALDKAMEYLTQASGLRREAAETAQRLEEVARVVGSSLTQAEERAGGLRQTSSELESRATALKAIDRQLGQFESLLGRWESAQTEAARALEQTLARQAAVEALEAQVKHVFNLAERTVEDVQTISSARREVEDTRALLEDTQAQFKATEDALQGFDARKRQLERAEQRLARAEALALGIRSTLESLQAQKTVMEHAMESAGALGFQMKQAEALINALRRERTLACELKAAMAEIDGDEEPTK